ncbi:MFS transporter [Shewanella sp. VB17]|uniref:MFS transporter n=1 Tax=Shewanella sp. VB17 TaxID=2739432 RepID=UPI0015653670|nr:MFS transporter [Shewanella sp. VB17]NRD75216.1 MFS transporter [Shewanella sp. VB17]
MRASLKVDVLFDANSVKLFIGQMSSQVCERIMSIGLVWFLMEQFGAIIVPWYLAVGALPHLLLLHRTPRWVDRLGALRCLYLTDFLRGLLFIIAAMSVVVMDWHEGSSFLWLIFILSFLNSCLGSLFNVAVMTLPMKMVSTDKVERLNAMVSSSFALAGIIGPIVGLLLFEKIGMAGVLVLNGISFILSGLLEMKIKLPAALNLVSKQNLEAAMPVKAEGMLAILKTDPLIKKMLLIFVAMNIVLTPILVFMPTFIKVVYQSDFSALVWFESAFAVGAVTSGLLLMLIQFNDKRLRRIIINLCMMSLGYLFFAFSSHYLFALFALFVIGGFLEAANVGIISFFQTRARPEQVPQVMAVINLVAVLAMPVSMVLVSILMNLTSVQLIAQSFAAILALISLSSFALKETKAPHDAAY